MKIFLFSFCAVFMTACGGSGYSDLFADDSDTTSGEIGPFVETADIRMEARHYQDEESNSTTYGIRITFEQRETFSSLKVGAGDSLSVNLNGVPQFVEDKRVSGCSGQRGLTNCRYYHTYQVTFHESPESKPLTIALVRQTGVNSVTTRTFPTKPTISAPMSGTSVNTSTDTTNVSWGPEEPGTNTDLIVSTEVCDPYKIVDADSLSEFTIAPAFFDRGVTCVQDRQGLIKTWRYLNYPADPALAQSSFLRLGMTDEVTVAFRP